jgi:hypothetical protein
MVYDSARGRCVLFGGFGAAQLPRDTWEWDGSSWRQVAATGPTGRYGFGMAYDVSRARTVLFGGTDAFNAFGDTWEWDGTVWQQVATEGPGARLGAALVYDSRRARVLLCGGSTTEVITMDLWEWGGTSWVPAAPSPITATGPSPRESAAIAYDGAREQLVLFGGTRSTTVMGDTWTFGKPRPCYANCDASTIAPVLNVNDFVCFLNRFAAGCP